MNCELCNDTKLIPFVNKQGQLRNDAFLDCECKVDEPDHYDIRPEDFDYPMSQSYREFTFEQYGRPWEKKSDIVMLAPVIQEAESQPWDQRQQHQIDQTRAEIKRLTMKVAALTGEKPKPEQPEKSAYKGLVVKEEE